MVRRSTSWADRFRPRESQESLTSRVRRIKANHPEWDRYPPDLQYMHMQDEIRVWEYNDQIQPAAGIDTIRSIEKHDRAKARREIQDLLKDAAELRSAGRDGEAELFERRAAGIARGVRFFVPRLGCFTVGEMVTAGWMALVKEGALPAQTHAATAGSWLAFVAMLQDAGKNTLDEALEAGTVDPARLASLVAAAMRFA